MTDDNGRQQRPTMTKNNNDDEQCNNKLCDNRSTWQLQTTTMMTTTNVGKPAHWLLALHVHFFSCRCCRIHWSLSCVVSCHCHLLSLLFFIAKLICCNKVDCCIAHCYRFFCLFWSLLLFVDVCRSLLSVDLCRRP